MIVIHIDTMADTARLKRAYEGLDNVTLLYNPTRAEMEETLKTNKDPMVMCLGHGSRFGLFDKKMCFNIIDKHNAYLFKDRQMIGIWCYASDFADWVGLHGYFTSMFVSNMGEALCLNFPNNTEEDIFHEIDVFCDQIHDFIKDNVKMSDWVNILQTNCHKEKDFVKFNYEAMTYFE